MYVIGKAAVANAVDLRSDSRLRELERLKSKVVRRGKTLHDGEDLYQELWLRFLMSDSHVDWNLHQSSIVMKTACRLQQRQGRDEKRRRRAMRLCARPLADVFTAGEVAEAREIQSLVRVAAERIRDPYKNILAYLLDGPGDAWARAQRLNISRSKIGESERRAIRLLALEMLGQAKNASLPLRGNRTTREKPFA